MHNNIELARVEFHLINIEQTIENMFCAVYWESAQEPALYLISSLFMSKTIQHFCVCIIELSKWWLWLVEMLQFTVCSNMQFNGNANSAFFCCCWCCCCCLLAAAFHLIFEISIAKNCINKMANTQTHRQRKKESYKHMYRGNGEYSLVGWQKQWAA